MLFNLSQTDLYIYIFFKQNKPVHHIITYFIVVYSFSSKYMYISLILYYHNPIQSFVFYFKIMFLNIA